MYIRIVSLKIEPGEVKEFRELYSKGIIPALESTEGCSFAYLIEGVKQDNEYLSILFGRTNYLQINMKPAASLGRLQQK